MNAESRSLAGRNVVITGSAGGLGKAVVEAFRAAGAECHLPISGATGDAGPGVHPTVGVDLTDEGAVERYYASLPPLAASVHLVGGYRGGRIAETTRADVVRMLELNLVTTFLCCREAARRMRASGGGPGGRIVNVGARVSEVPIAEASAYTAAKAAVAGLTRALAAELKADGILVNAVLPSIIDTPANRAAMPKADFARWPKPEEVAAAIVWLASPENRLTSGALIPVYGSA